MTVDIVQMHNIRPEPLQFPNHLPGSFLGIEPIITQHFGFQRLQLDIFGIRTGNSQGIPIGPAAEDMVFDIFGSQNAADANTYLPSAADATGGIDLNYLHPTFSQKK
jgi:hypothetical protein